VYRLVNTIGTDTEFSPEEKQIFLATGALSEEVRKTFQLPYDIVLCI
jgi:hypothetical protein